MPLIAERPRTWNQLIGQDRVLQMLHALLRKPQHLTRGLVFEGPWAVGKTSAAYLFAQALMCQGDNPLGCGTCPSCRTAIEDLEAHPDFHEIDAALLKDKADEVRNLVNTLSGAPILGRRKVAVLDEAHRLSVEAFDVFLKPLEKADTEVIFIFVSSAASKVPGTISSRCSILRFGKVDQDSLIGMMMVEADRLGIPYRADGLRALARQAQGRPRDAKKGLSLVAALGEVTPETVETALNYEAETIAGEAYRALVARDLQGAIVKADALAQRIGPVDVISTLFHVYSDDLFTTSAFAPSFAPLRDMTAFFIKWSATVHLPADIIPLFMVELNEMRGDLYRRSEQEQVRPRLTEGGKKEQVVRVNDEDKILSGPELKKFVEEF